MWDVYFFALSYLLLPNLGKSDGKVFLGSKSKSENSLNPFDATEKKCCLSLNFTCLKKELHVLGN